MTFRRYRRRTPLVEAVEVGITTLEAIRRIPGCSIVASPMGNGVRVYVRTTTGDEIAGPGDHIIIDPKGTLEVVAMVEFDQIYEPAD